MPFFNLFCTILGTHFRFTSFTYYLILIFFIILSLFIVNCTLLNFLYYTLCYWYFKSSLSSSCICCTYTAQEFFFLPRFSASTIYRFFLFFLRHNLHNRPGDLAVYRKPAIALTKLNIFPSGEGLTSCSLVIYFNYCTY